MAREDMHEGILGGERDQITALRNRVTALESAQSENLAEIERLRVGKERAESAMEVKVSQLDDSMKDCRKLRSALGDRSEFDRGWRQALGEVAASVGSDIRSIYKGQLWADKIVAVMDERDSLQASLAASEALSERRRAALDEMYVGAIARIGLDKTRAKYSRQYAVLAAATPATALAERDANIRAEFLRSICQLIAGEESVTSGDVSPEFRDEWAVVRKSIAVALVRRHNSLERYVDGEWLAAHDLAVKVRQLRELAEKFKAMSDRMNQSTGLGNWAYSHAYGRCEEIVLTEATRLEGERNDKQD